MTTHAQTEVDERSTPTIATRWVALILLGEVVLSAVLGSVELGTRSLWIDEGFSAMATSRGLGEVVRIAFHVDSNMPLYLGGLRVWRVVAGSGEIGLRSFSVAAAALSVVAVYLLTERLADRVSGLVAGLVLAIAPYGVRYSQEARGYSMLVLLVTAATYAFVAAVQSHRAGSRDVGWWVAYAVLGAAACYAHLVAAFVIPAQLVSLVLLDRAAIPVRRVVGAVVGLAVLLVPLGVMVMSAADNEGVGAPRVSTVPGYLAEAAGSRPLLLVFAFGALVVVYQAWVALRSRGRSIEAWSLAFPVLMVMVPVVGLFASAVLTDKNWAPRYLIVVLPFLCVTVAMALRRVDWRLAAVGLVAIGVLSAVEVKSVFDAPARDDWRGAVAFIAAEGSSADGVVICPSGNRPAFEYYLLRRPDGIRPDPLQPTAPWGPGLHQQRNADAEAMTAAGAPDRAWVVSRPPEADDPLCELPDAAGDRTRALRRTFGEVTVERYDR